MASPYSQIQQVRNPIKSVNTELFGQVVGAKQQNFSKNEALINQTISEISKIDLLRDPDKAYLQERLKKVVNIVQNTDNIDFTSGSAGARLGSFITQAIDGNVKKHAAITAQKRAFDTNLEKLKTKDPEKYNQTNHQDALIEAGFYDYMKGESADDSISQLSYNPYVDYQSESLKRIKTLKDVFPDQDIQFKDSEGVLKTKKKSALNEMEWRQVIKSSFTSQEKNQMAIEGRATYRAMAGGDNKRKDEFAAQDYNKRRTGIKADYDKVIADLTLKLTTATGSRKKELENAIEEAQQYKTKDLAYMDVSDKTAGNIGATLLMNNIASSYAKAAAVEYVTKSDFSALNYKLKLRDQNFKEAKYLQDREDKLRAELITDPSKKPFAKNAITDTEKEKESYIELYSQVEQEVIGEYDAEVEKIYNSLNSKSFNLPKGHTILKKNAAGEEVEIVDPTMTQVLEDVTQDFFEEKGVQPTPEELKVAVVERARAEGLLTLDQSEPLDDKRDSVNYYSNNKEQAAEEAVVNSIAKNAGDFYDELVGNWELLGAEKNIVYFRKDGTEIKMYEKFEELNKKGIKTKEDYIEFISGDSEDAKEVRANIALQRGNTMELYNTPSRYGTRNTRVKILDEKYNMFQPTAKQYFGTSYEKLSKKIQDLDTGGRGGDYTINNEMVLSRGLEVEEYEKNYANALGKRSAKIGGVATIEVPPGTEEYEMVKTMVSSDQTWTKNQGFSLRRLEDGNVEVFQQESREKDETDVYGQTRKGSITNTAKRAIIQSDVVRKPQFSKIGDYFKGTEGTGKLQQEDGFNITLDNMNYQLQGMEYTRVIEKRFPGDQYKGVRAKLRASTAPLQILQETMGTPPTTNSSENYIKSYNSTKQLLKNAAENINNFKIEINNLSGVTYAEVYRKRDSNGKEITPKLITEIKLPPSNMSFAQEKNFLRSVPSVTFSNILQNSVEMYKQGDKSILEELGN